MKTLFISLAALAAVSSAVLASDRAYGQRSSGTDFGMYPTKHKAQSYATDSNALVIVKSDKKKLTVFERMKRISEENDHGNDGKSRSQPES